MPSHYSESLTHARELREDIESKFPEAAKAVDHFVPVLVDFAVTTASGNPMAGKISSATVSTPGIKEEVVPAIKDAVVAAATDGLLMLALPITIPVMISLAIKGWLEDR